MKEIHDIVAYNLKMFRKDNGLTLDNVSRRTGVSKTMLSQIERGDSIPSITTVWKIANGLKISFMTLIKSPDQKVEVKRKGEIMEMTSDDGRYRLYPYFPFESGAQIEMYQFEIEPGGAYNAEPHQAGTSEYIIISEGMMNLKIQNEDYQMESDMAIKFDADVSHSYMNIGDSIVHGIMTIYYPEQTL
ncbi:helix-turn-helix domain-containing protein [Macrococcus sp. EM39E]|uniref:helix-turn-helix domain-containing protein n=1 Tax=Macrococcus animalis TaxID=3395467 RepID=UPI0039BEBE5B